MRAEIRVPVAILRGRTAADAIGQNGFEKFKIAPGKARLTVHNDSGEANRTRKLDFTGLEVSAAEES